MGCRSINGAGNFLRADSADSVAVCGDDDPKIPGGDTRFPCSLVIAVKVGYPDPGTEGMNMTAYNNHTNS